jgi:hypothetical protein
MRNSLFLKAGNVVLEQVLNGLRTMRYSRIIQSNLDLANGMEPVVFHIYLKFPYVKFELKICNLQSLLIKTQQIILQ